MRYVLIFFLWLLPFLASAQKVVVSLAEGKTTSINVYESQRADAKIVATIAKDEFAYCHQCLERWCKVDVISLSLITGYVHKEDIDPVTYLPDSVQKAMIDTVFKQYIIFTEKARKATVTDSTTRKKAEHYGIANYSPILTVFPDYFCRTSDTVVLASLFKAAFAGGEAAVVSANYTLAKCFICNTSLMLDMIKNLNVGQQSVIATYIDNGLAKMAETQKDSKRIEQIKALRKKLEEFRK